MAKAALPFHVQLEGTSRYHCTHIFGKKGLGSPHANSDSAAVTLPDCNCGSVGSRRLRMINRAVIRTSSHNR